MRRSKRRPRVAARSASRSMRSTKQQSASSRASRSSARAAHSRLSQDSADDRLAAGCRASANATFSMSHWRISTWSRSGGSRETVRVPSSLRNKPSMERFVKACFDLRSSILAAAPSRSSDQVSPRSTSIQTVPSGNRSSATFLMWPRTGGPSRNAGFGNATSALTGYSPPVEVWMILPTCHTTCCTTQFRQTIRGRRHTRGRWRSRFVPGTSRNYRNERGGQACLPGRPTSL